MSIYRGAGGAGDAVNDSSSEATLIQQLAIEAQDSADAAATSETNAAASETAAASSASAASTSASNAATSATNAANSASSASTSATNAASSASTATTKASEASTSATNAATSASAASTSATNAASSATTATTQATNASNSASAAATSATNASNSATAASTSASNASTSATNAASSASAASTSASNAATSETNAASSASSASTSATTATTQAGIATTKAGEAATSATNAATSATNASNSASSASTSATNASNSASSAATSATNAAASYDSFDDRYLGAKSVAPTLDNDGNTLLVGALYFNTVSNFMKVWDGSSWLDAYASLSGALLSANNLSDLANAATARTNLGVTATGADTTYAFRANNLSDLASASTARTNLGLGTIATQAASSVAITGGTINGTTIGATTPSTVSATSLTDSGNLTFTGTGNRITGDFSNATLANRVFFQTSTTNGNSSLQVMPNGTANFSGFNFLNSSDTSNYAGIQIRTSSTEIGFSGFALGTGTQLPMTFAVGGSERLRIDTSGNVGIGTTSPAKKFEVRGTDAAARFRGSSIQFLDITATSGGTVNLDANNGEFAVSVNNTERMRITSAGDVGIGTSSPAYKLDINRGTSGVVAKFTGASSSYIFGGSTSSYFSGDTSANNAFGVDSTNNNAQVFTNGTERMRIDSAGNVGIGTSSPSTYGKFVVNGASNADAGIFIGNQSLTGSAPTYKGTVRIIDNPTSSTGTSGGIEFLTSTFGSGYGWKIASIDSSGVQLTFATRQNSASWTEAMRIDSSGNLLFNSGYGSVATAYGCRAWVNFNGTGTVAIRASGNVSSITDQATGKYTINFTAAMPDASYSAVAMMRADTDYAPTVGQPHEYAAQSASSVSLKTGNAGAALDSSIVTVAVFR